VIYSSWLQGKAVNCGEFRNAGAIDHVVMVEQDIPSVSYSGIPAAFLGIFEPVRDMFVFQFGCQAK